MNYFIRETMKSLIAVSLITLCVIVGFFIYQAYHAANNFDFEYAEELKERTKPVEVEEDFEIITAEITTEDIKEYIIKVANLYGVDQNLALKIAECESQFKNVCNYQYGCIGGIGIYQLVQSTFDETLERMLEAYKIDQFSVYYYGKGDPYNIKDNIDIAIWLMSEKEFWRWNASKNCWKI